MLTNYIIMDWLVFQWKHRHTLFTYVCMHSLPHNWQRKIQRIEKIIRKKSAKKLFLSRWQIPVLSVILLTFIHSFVRPIAFTTSAAVNPLWFALPSYERRDFFSSSIDASNSTNFTTGPDRQHKHTIDFWACTHYI